MKYSAGLALKQIYKVGKWSLRIHQQSNGSFKGGGQPVSCVVFTGPVINMWKVRQYNIHSCSAYGKHTHADNFYRQIVQQPISSASQMRHLQHIMWSRLIPFYETPWNSQCFASVCSSTHFLPSSGPCLIPHLQSQACFLVPKRPWSSSDIPSPQTVAITTPLGPSCQFLISSSPSHSHFWKSKQTKHPLPDPLLYAE